MKEFKMDQFFRDKLEARKVTPSEDAWNKLSFELNKNKKRKVLAYWYVAAGIMIFLGFGYVFFFQINTNIESSPLANQQQIEGSVLSTPIQNPDQLIKEEDLDNEINIEPEHENFMAEKQLEKNQENSHQNSIVKSENNSALTPEKNSPETMQKISIVEKTILAELVVEETTENAMNEIEPIVVQPDEINIEEALAYERNKNTLSEEYPEIVITYKKSDSGVKPESEKTFQKIAKLARDFSEGGYGIGQLREAKNELLAFDRKINKDN